MLRYSKKRAERVCCNQGADIEIIVGENGKVEVTNGIEAIDFHNITFDKYFTLAVNKTYNYEIRTGSYPQIHHADALLTENGWINCTEFVDANRRVYNAWIPAIRLC